MCLLVLLVLCCWVRFFDVFGVVLVIWLWFIRLDLVAALDFSCMLQFWLFCCQIGGFVGCWLVVVVG